MSRHLYDGDAERVLLGAMLIRNTVFDEVCDQLEPEYFGVHEHRVIYRALQALHATGRPLDLVTLKDQLMRDGTLEEAGTPARLAALIDGVPHSLNAPHYLAIVRDRAKLRALRDIGRQIIAASEDGEDSGVELLDRAEQLIYGLSAQSVVSDWMGPDAIATKLYELVERIDRTGGSVSGVSTGLADLDWVTRGLQPSDLVLLGARPSVGKTALALQVATHAAASGPVAFFSVEMALQPLTLRSVAARANVDMFRLLSGFSTEIELRRVSEAITDIGQLQLYVDETPHLNPIHVRSKLRRLRARVGALRLVVIDYMQLLDALPDHKRETRATQMAGVCRTLKLLAREFGCPFLVLSQLNRASERSTDKRPSLADLRESGALEQDADVVLLMHRPDQHEQSSEAVSETELIVAKQRNGPTTRLTLRFNKAQLRFEEQAAASAPEPAQGELV